MARDIGGYFDELKRRGRGGRRLGRNGKDEQPDRGSAGPNSGTHGPGSGGGLADKLKDIVDTGRSAATSASETLSKKARERLGQRPSGTGQTRRTKGGGAARRLPPEGVVTVEYSPRIDGDPDPGEVVWTWVPFEEDPEQGKDRPVVVIGRRGRNLVGVPLTTKHSDREAQIAIGTGDWDPKRRKSYARIWRMLDIDADRTRREGAVLGRERFDAVIHAVDEYYDVRHPAGTETHDDAAYDD